MSRCLNKATLIGYLGADPEIRTTSSGARVAQFSLGTTRRWNDRNGQPQEKTQWHRVLVWDSLPGTFVEKYLRKGDRVYVEGEIDYRSYETDSGDTRWTTEIKASEILGAGEFARGDERRRVRSTRTRAVVEAEAELALAL
jgi:single-strand DNA-binding protein